MSKNAKSLRATQYLMLLTLRLDGYEMFLSVHTDVMQLEIEKELKVDPRHMNSAVDCISCVY
jgi:hypothetical protein